MAFVRPFTGLIQPDWHGSRVNIHVAKRPQGGDHRDVVRLHRVRKLSQQRHASCWRHVPDTSLHKVTVRRREGTIDLGFEVNVLDSRHISVKLQHGAIALEGGGRDSTG